MQCQSSNEIGEILRAARVRQGVSQRRLALRAGTSQDAISRIERGVESPTLERFAQLVLALGLRPALGLEPRPSPVARDELRVAEALTPRERLREANGWNRVAAQLAMAGERARREGSSATRRSLP